MNARRLSTTSRVRSWARRAAAATAIGATLAGLGAASSAQAWVSSIATGRTGAVSLPMFAVSDVGDAYGGLALAADRNFIAYRSPASSGAQSIRANYSVAKWDGSQWVTILISPTMTAYLSASQTYGSFARANLRPNSSRGYFQVSVTAAWLDAQGNTLAFAFYSTSNYSDYACTTQIRLCANYGSYVRTGGYLTNQW